MQLHHIYSLISLLMCVFLAFGIKNGASRLISLWWSWRNKRLDRQAVDWITPKERQLLDWTFFIASLPFFLSIAEILLSKHLSIHPLINIESGYWKHPLSYLRLCKQISTSMIFLMLFTLLTSISLRRAKSTILVKLVFVWGCLSIIGTHVLEYFGWYQSVFAILAAKQFSIANQKISLSTLVENSFDLMFNIVSIYAMGHLLETYIRKSNHGLESNSRIALIRLLWTIITAIAIIRSLYIMGLNLSVLSVLGGAVGVGIGFGLQKIASNYISGYIILLEKSFRIGDSIRISDGTTGIITQIRTRYSVIRSSDGIETVLPNETLMTNTVKNLSFTEASIMLDTEIMASYRHHPNDILKILVSALQTCEAILPKPAPNASVKKFTDAGILYRITFWIADPRNGQSSAISQANIAIWEAFRKHQIFIPISGQSTTLEQLATANTEPPTPSR